MQIQVHQSILYFGINPWHTIRQRPQQIAKLLSKHNDVVYVNPIMDPIFFAFYGVLKRSFSTNMTLTPNVEVQSPSLCVIDPPSLVPGVSFVGALNDVFMKFLARSVLSYGRERDHEYDVIWLSHPRQASVLKTLGSEYTVCYDCMDDYPNLEIPSRRSYYDLNEKHILSRADIVFATSRVLEEKCRKHASNVIRVPNGVDVNHFCPTHNVEPSRGVKRPVIGFFGYLGAWMDVDLIAYAATKRRNWDFHIIGPQFNPAFRNIAAMDNVKMFGEIAYESLPEYAKRFDVCMIPFRTDDLMHSVNPVKVYEYLATGKPIVSTDLQEVRQFAPFVRIAHGMDEFVSLLDDSVQEKDQGVRAERVRIAEKNSWDERVRVIENSLGSVPTKKS